MPEFTEHGEHEEEIMDAAKNALTWAETAREELFEAMKLVGGTNKHADLAALGDAHASITDGMEALRAILGLPPEMIEDGRDFEDEGEAY